MRFLDKVIKCAPYSSNVPVHQRHDHLYLPSRWVTRTLYKNKKRATDFVELWFKDSISFFKEQNKQTVIDAILNMKNPNRNRLLFNIFGLGMACFYHEFYEGRFVANSLSFFARPATLKLLDYHDLKLPKGNLSLYQEIRKQETPRITSDMLYSIYLDLGGTLAEKVFQIELMNSGFYMPYRQVKKKAYQWGFIHLNVGNTFNTVTEEDLFRSEQEIDYLGYLKELEYIKKKGKCRITHLF